MARRGAGLPGVFRDIRKNTTALRNLLWFFPDLFKVRGGNVSLVVANFPRQCKWSKHGKNAWTARREQADMAREAKKQERLAGLRAAYADHPK